MNLKYYNAGEQGVMTIPCPRSTKDPLKIGRQYAFLPHTGGLWVRQSDLYDSYEEAKKSHPAVFLDVKMTLKVLLCKDPAFLGTGASVEDVDSFAQTLATELSRRFQREVTVELTNIYGIFASWAILEEAARSIHRDLHELYELGLIKEG